MPDTIDKRVPGIRLTRLQATDSVQAAYEITRPLTVIGSGSGSDLVIGPDAVDAAHTSIVRLGSGAFVCDLGAARGTRVNGTFVRWARLEHGDELAIGPYCYRVEIDECPDAVVTTVWPFSLRNNQTIGTVFSEDPALVIGSNASCDVVLGEGTIAPRHALVAWTSDGPIVRDLRGRRSVRVNGRWVNESRISPGDSIGVGDYELIFETQAAVTGQAYGGAVRSTSGWRLEGSPMSPSQPAANRRLEPQAAQLAGANAKDETAVAADDAGASAELSEDEASRELVRVMEQLEYSHEAGDGEDSLDAVSLEALDDSDVLDLLDEVQRIDEFAAASSSGSGAGSEDETQLGGPSESLHADRLIDGQLQELNRCPTDLRARVVAAQEALDERARKMRAELDAERTRLKTCQERLQAQARKLLHAAEATRSSAGGSKPAGDADSADFDKDGNGSNGKHAANRDHSGIVNDDIDPLHRSGLIQFDAVGHPVGAPDKSKQNASLHEQVSELARMVREERDEMQESESRLEAMKFEIERLRDEVARSRERHHTRQAEHETRYQTLARGLTALAQERESLVARLRRLDNKKTALTTRMADAERVKKELARESERLARLQDQHDERLRELRINLESERHRLRMRQAELQRKASELARMARSRRTEIEEIVAEQQSNLKAQESEIKSRQSALVEAGRAELERTATELEQVLSVRLSDVEAELLTRQESLDTWIHTIYDTTGQKQAASRKSETGFARASVRAMDTRSIPGRASISQPTPDVRHLAQLESELEGLHRAVMRLDGDSERSVARIDPIVDEESSGVRNASTATRERTGGLRGSRWPRGGSSLTSKLSERISSLRSVIEEIGTTTGDDSRRNRGRETQAEPVSIDAP